MRLIGLMGVGGWDRKGLRGGDLEVPQELPWKSALKIVAVAVIARACRSLR
jgi:hypothetical protein